VQVLSSTFPAKSPELNPAENAHNTRKHTVIPYVLKRERDNNESWEDEVTIVETAIGVLTVGVIYQNYSQNLFAAFSGRQDRYGWVVDNDGELHPNELARKRVFDNNL
jgi:hypothetical protein